MAANPIPAPTPPARVAIVTRTRNRPLMLPRCLESVLGQSCSDWLHLIVNDGGDAAALEHLLEPYRARYAGRLKVLHHATGEGMQQASNRGIRESESEFIVIHDDDDSWEPDFLRRTLAHWDLEAARGGEPAVGVIAQINWIVEERSEDAWREVWRGDYLPAARVGLLDALRRNPTAPIAFLYRRELHAELGLYDATHDVLGDWVFLLEVLKRHRVLVLDEKLANYHWRAADRPTPEGYENTVTAQLAHHLELRHRFVDQRLREALAAQPQLEGPLLALTQPLLETAEASSALLRGQEGLKHWQEETSRRLEERFAALDERIAQRPTGEALHGVHEALRAQLVEVREVQLETLGHLGRVLEELARVKERDYWMQKALDHHSVQLDWTRGTLERHSAELHELLEKAREVFKRLRRWEFAVTRDPALHDARTEIEELNLESYDAADAHSDEGAAAEFRHWLPTARVVSFDVFDTALLRRCGDPLAVFALVEARLPGELASRLRDFPRRRVEAERAAREARAAEGLGDVTFAEIYAELAAHAGLDTAEANAVAELELGIERSVLIANPSILTLVDEARAAGKEVIFLSDMYLETETVAALLEGAGFPPARLFVSSHHRRTKHGGELYGVVAEALGVAPGEILHLGDNLFSDVDKAAEAGLRAIHWNGLRGGWPLAEQVHPFGTWRERALPARLTWGLARCRRAGLAHRRRAETFWETLGYEIAGPVYYHFLSWIIGQAQADGVRNLFFLSRDGFYLVEAFKRFRAARDLGGLQGHYLYASRRLYNLASRGYLDPTVLEFILSPNPYTRVRDFLERLGLSVEPYRAALARHGFTNLDRVLTRPQGGFKSAAQEAKLARFFQEIAPAIESLAQAEATTLQAYFADAGVDQPGSAIVDIGWGATSLLAIQSILERRRPGHRQLGYYFGTWDFAQPVVNRGCRLKSYFMHLEAPDSSAEVLTSAVEALEFIFTAPHGSVEGLRREGGGWKPIEAPLENPPERLEALRRMHQAGLDFVDDMLSFDLPLGAADPIADGYLRAVFHRFLKNPTPAEAEAYGRLHTRDSFGSRSRLRPLAAIPPARFFKSRAIARGLEESYWKNGYAALVRGHDA
jgi:FMN phosphatase YigB (HAD superfamily)